MSKTALLFALSDLFSSRLFLSQCQVTIFSNVLLIDCPDRLWDGLSQVGETLQPQRLEVERVELWRSGMRWGSMSIDYWLP